MSKDLPNLESYFLALNVFMIGDLLVFNKNCELADKSDSYYKPNSNSTLKDLIRDEVPVYSSIYSDPGSHAMGAYIENPNPRLTIPLALTLFSVMELLGIFYTGETHAKSTTKNISTFFGKVPEPDRPSSDDIANLIKIYRHGLAHQYFPKGQYSLSYSLKNPDTLFFTDRKKYLNVNYLKKLVVQGFRCIENDRDNYKLMEANISKMLSDE